MIRLIRVVLVVLPTLAAFQAVMATPGLHEMLVVLETILLVHLVKLANQATGDKRSDPSLPPRHMDYSIVTSSLGFILCYSTICSIHSLIFPRACLISVLIFPESILAHFPVSNT